MKNYLKVYCVEFHLYHPITGDFYPYYQDFDSYYQHITAYNISDAWQCVQATWPQYYDAYMRGEFTIYLKQI